MKPKEKAESIALITEKVRKRGIPINVRQGGNAEAAEWVGKLLEELLEIDEPIGTIEMYGFTACPKCFGIVGNSGWYCRSCGEYLRFKPGGGQNEGLGRKH